ncbi:MAG: 50S ribosomal protein L3 [Candidatus Hydrothermarchaeaceae archaeon]
MGRRAHHPRRGSLGYSPRKRAASLTPRIRSWVGGAGAKIQGFCGYKAGTTHVTMIDDFPHSLTHNEEITTAATVIDTPPLKVCGVRAYGRDVGGRIVLKEAWHQKPESDLARVFPVPKAFKSNIEELKPVLEKAEELRLIICTQPRLSGVSKKRPDIMEYQIGGGIDEAYEYAKGALGKEIKVSDVFADGEYIDTISITKGKGFQSPLKKWGLKHLPRKDRKGHKTAGNLGPWHPAAMMWTVPTSGQMGYHQRTENNLRILKMGTKDEEITPSGGFLGYGVVKGEYILLKGSVPGPRNRLIRLRPALRRNKGIPGGVPQLTYVSRSSKQGT